MRAKDMRSNDGCCNNVPIRFASAKEMFEYLQDVGDLYSPDERIYVFNYSECLIPRRCGTDFMLPTGM